MVVLNVSGQKSSIIWFALDWLWLVTSWTTLGRGATPAGKFYTSIFSSSFISVIPDNRVISKWMELLDQIEQKCRNNSAMLIALSVFWFDFKKNGYNENMQRKRLLL